MDIRAALMQFLPTVKTQPLKIDTNSTPFVKNTTESAFYVWVKAVCNEHLGSFKAALTQFLTRAATASIFLHVTQYTYACLAAKLYPCSAKLFSLHKSYKTHFFCKINQSSCKLQRIKQRMYTKQHDRKNLQVWVLSSCLSNSLVTVHLFKTCFPLLARRASCDRLCACHVRR